MYNNKQEQDVDVKYSVCFIQFSSFKCKSVWCGNFSDDNLDEFF